MNLGPYTLREAIELRDARLRIDWDRVSVLQATMFNVNRPAKSEPIQPSQLNPFRQQRKPSRKRDDDQLDRYIDFHQRRFKAKGLT